jgi:ribonucleoside-triphosphate reductase
MYYVKKKDGREVPFDPNKIISAVTKSAERVMVTFTDKDHNKIIQLIQSRLSNTYQSVDVPTMHKLVEMALDEVNPSVAQSYRSYRNYKQNFVGIVDKVHRDMNAVAYRGDKSNSNTDSKLVTTQRSIGYGKLNDELYKQFFLNPEERQAAKDGYIYIHDRSARLDTMNCVLLDIKAIFEGGFEMGNLPYTDPHTVDVACDVLGDVIMAAASSQYGGLSVRVDDFLAPYCQKSFDKYYKKYFDMIEDMCGMEASKEDVIKYATKDVIRELEQGLQGLEIKLNSVASSRGDYPFVSFAFGLDTNHWGRIVSETALRVRMGGQGKEGFKRPVLFPKLIFLYDENLHGSGGELEELFNVAIECSSKAMYPDFLSLTGEGYVPSIYKKYGKVIYPMGCRAFLSPWYERGGINPADENDVPVFTGRFNIGAITLNLIMILAKAREEGKDFYEVLDYYLEMIRKLHLRTYDYLGNKQASISPITYCEGGFYGGHLNPSDKIAPVLKSATASFGITGLNELNVLYNGKTIAEDGQFPLEVMEYINRKVSEFKEKDQRLYAIYGTPAESLCGLQIEQFRAKYGIINGVSSRSYTTNSFHCWVGEDIDPIQKQDIEYKFWNLFNGGKIQYVRYPIDYNIEAMKTLVRRAMKLGYYEGINMALSYCNDCGHQELNMEVCPICRSENLTKIDRMNGYLSYSRVKGDTMLNEAKMAEIRDRKSM